MPARRSLWKPWKLYFIGTIITAMLLVLGIPLLILKNPQILFWNVPVEGPKIKLQLKDGKVYDIPMEEYLAGVLSGEMSPLDPPEALKAMAVAARSYAWYHALKGEPICTTVHCQVWLSSEEREQRWGQKTQLYTWRIEQAVKATQGQFLLYHNQVIDATYHAACGGHTESAADVWGTDILYLQSVSCPEKPVVKEARFTPEELDAKFGTALATMSPKDRAKALQVADKTAGGRAKTIRIGRTDLEGTKFRSLLGLSSTDLQMEWDKDQLRIQTRGYGHAVGLCQTGDITMAEEGKNYEEILAHYYPETELKKMY
ncbi:stage II sporulation protein D [Heliobacillus mobilis]|uniref:Stage II sporulation protein D n=1 Tax=Heliobacterium mobile TaxID=28064 RepID=A0A6I3SKU9_HELMO|nr:stage II sporulation protein D [Heliobacterium mobile]MTV49588.1 stage II sporulation protein D [Heliobacterium mobile]